MDLAQIYHKANLLIAQTYGLTGIPEKDMSLFLSMMSSILYTFIEWKTAGILRK